MSTRIGPYCVVYSRGAGKGLRVEVTVGPGQLDLNEEQALKIIEDLKAAAEIAWPRPQQPLTKFRQGI